MSFWQRARTTSTPVSPMESCLKTGRSASVPGECTSPWVSWGFILLWVNWWEGSLRRSWGLGCSLLWETLGQIPWAPFRIPVCYQLIWRRDSWGRCDQYLWWFVRRQGVVFVGRDVVLLIWGWGIAPRWFWYLVWWAYFLFFKKERNPL